MIVDDRAALVKSKERLNVWVWRAAMLFLISAIGGMLVFTAKIFLHARMDVADIGALFSSIITLIFSMLLLFWRFVDLRSHQIINPVVLLEFVICAFVISQAAVSIRFFDWAAALIQISALSIVAALTYRALKGAKALYI